MITLHVVAAQAEEAAKAMGWSRRSLLRAADAGRIEKHYRSPRSPVFLAEDLLRLVREAPTEAPTNS